MLDQRFRLLVVRGIGYIIGRKQMMKCIHKWKKLSLKNPLTRLVLVVFLIVSTATFLSHPLLLKDKQSFSAPNVVSNLNVNESLQQLTTDVAANSLTADRNLYHRNPIKNILLYNPLPGRMGSLLGAGKRFFSRNRCPVDRCKLYVNPFVLIKRPLDYYDAVVFNVNAFRSSEFLKKDVSEARRRPQQRFVAFNNEAPVHTWKHIAHLKDFAQGFFNWSMSYRQDADVHLHYGTIRHVNQLQSEESMRRKQKIMNKKINNGSTAIAAWMASHCTTNSRREDYVEELKKYMDVDVYGTCGNLHCDRNEVTLESFPKCYDMIESKYKFYLSFENSICTDYVTEKFFRIAQLDSVVPVVYGGADYSRIAPPHSYIDARQFKPKQLADYLKKLDANDALFDEYLQWKDQYIVEAGVDQQVRNSFCELCQKLHREDDKKPKNYDQLVSHWLPDKQCTTPLT